MLNLKTTEQLKTTRVEILEIWKGVYKQAECLNELSIVNVINSAKYDNWIYLYFPDFSVFSQFFLLLSAALNV